MRFIFAAALTMAGLRGFAVPPPVDPFVTVTPAPVPPQPSAPPIKAREFRVGSVGSVLGPTRDELLRVFAAFQAQYRLLPDGGIVNADAQAGLAAVVRLTGFIKSAGGGDVYIFSESPDNYEPAAQAAVRRLAGREKWTDGESFTIWARRDGVFDWTTVTGAARRSPLYVEISFSGSPPLPNAPDRAAFLAALKAGQHFGVFAERRMMCPTCGGRRQVRGRADEGYNPDTFWPCPTCHGTGAISEIENLDVSW